MDISGRSARKIRSERVSVKGLLEIGLEDIRAVPIKALDQNEYIVIASLGATKVELVTCGD